MGVTAAHDRASHGRCYAKVSSRRTEGGQENWRVRNFFLGEGHFIFTVFYLMCERFRLTWHNKI
jgi:hypothetical protein